MEEKEAKHGYGVVHFEKRRYPRLSVNLPFEYRHAASPPQKSETINASQGGIAVYLREPLEVGRHLKVKLFFSSESELNAIETTAEIVWADAQKKDWRGYQAGLKFLEVSSEDANKLKSFLTGLSK